VEDGILDKFEVGVNELYFDGLELLGFLVEEAEGDGGFEEAEDLLLDFEIEGCLD
jgi:hypothetical protein